MVGDGVNDAPALARGCRPCDRHRHRRRDRVGRRCARIVRSAQRSHGRPTLRVRPLPQDGAEPGLGGGLQHHHDPTRRRSAHVGGHHAAACGRRNPESCRRSSWRSTRSCSAGCAWCLQSSPSHMEHGRGSRRALASRWHGGLSSTRCVPIAREKPSPKVHHRVAPGNSPDPAGRAATIRAMAPDQPIGVVADGTPLLAAGIRRRWRVPVSTSRGRPGSAPRWRGWWRPVMRTWW